MTDRPRRSAAASTTRRLAERPLDLQPLLQQDLAIHTFDCLGCLLLGLILDEGIALHKARPTVKVEMQILDVSKLGEGLVDIVLLCLLMHPRRDDHPPLYRACWARIVLLILQALERAGLPSIAVIILSTAALDPAHRLRTFVLIIINVHGCRLPQLEEASSKATSGCRPKN